MTLPTARHVRVAFRLTVLALITALAQAQQPAAAPAASPPAKKPATTDGSHPAATDAATSQKSAVSYSLGVSMGTQLRGNGVAADAINSQRLAQGVHDALIGKAKLTEADQNNITALVRSSAEGVADSNHRAAAKFLAENAKKAGVITTASGLQYKVLAPGSGESPKANDEATVNYRGTLLGGTEFDSSYKRGEPATFQVSRVIPGWTEALQLMKPGAKYQLFIPPQLAYDLRSRPPIPPGSMLIFDVELLSFKSGPAPAAAAPPAAGQSGEAASAPPPK